MNLIGEHTDYNDGFVLPMAIDRYTVVSSAINDAGALHVYSAQMNDSLTLALDEPFVKRGTWADYVAGVLAAVQEEAPLHTGLDLRIESDLPMGAGLSSSASLELALAMALFASQGGVPELHRLAAIGRRAEHDFVGIRSGVMDQLVCALGQEGCALFIDCRTLAAQPVAMPAGVCVAILDSGEKHALASSEYNERRAACEKGVKLLRAAGLDIQALRDVTPEMFEQYRSALPSPVRERCRHVVEENRRTLDAVTALTAGDLPHFGQLMYASHESLRSLYEVSTPKLDALVEAASAIDGVYGARMTGGGFGGSVVVLCTSEAAKAVGAIPAAAVYLTVPSSGVRERPGPAAPPGALSVRGR